MTRVAAGLLGVLLGCPPPADSDPDTAPPDDSTPPEETAPPDETDEPTPWLEPGAQHSLGTGTFVRVLPQDEGFLVGLARPGEGYRALGFDAGWQPTQLDKGLSGPDAREPDHDLAQAGSHLFHALLTRAPDGDGLAMDRLGPDMQPDAGTGHLPQEPDERALDPSLLATEDHIWLATEYREDAASWDGNIAPSAALARGLLLRELDTDLALVATHRLTATIPGSSTPGQYWGLGAGQLRDADAHWVFAASPSGEPDQFEEGESAGTRRIWALEHDPTLGLRAVHGPLTSPDRDAYWCTGVARLDELWVVSYTFRRPEDGPVLGPPSPDGGNIGLLLLDEDLSVLQRLDLTAIASEDLAAGRGAHRSAVAVENETLWVSWDEAGQAQVAELSLQRGPQGRPRMGRR